MEHVRFKTHLFNTISTAFWKTNIFFIVIFFLYTNENYIKRTSATGLILTDVYTVFL